VSRPFESPVPSPTDLLFHAVLRSKTMIDLLFATVVVGFAIEFTVLYELHQIAIDVRHQLSELYIRRPRAASPYPSTGTPAV
jgi:hypothetical protein